MITGKQLAACQGDFGKSDRNQIPQLEAIANDEGVEFLQIDLAAALTIARMCLQSTDLEKRAKQTEKVRKAYDSVLHFLPRVKMSESAARAVHDKLQELGENLTALGQSI